MSVTDEQALAEPQTADEKRLLAELDRAYWCRSWNTVAIYARALDDAIYWRRRREAAPDAVQVPVIGQTRDERPRTAPGRVMEATAYAWAICSVCLLNIYAPTLATVDDDAHSRFHPIGWRHQAGDPILKGHHDATPQPDTIRQARHIPGTDARPGSDGNTDDWVTQVIEKVNDKISHAPNQCATCGLAIVWRTEPDGKESEGWWGHVASDLYDHAALPAH